MTSPEQHAATVAFDRVADRLSACREDVSTRPYSHPIAVGWYAEDVPALVALAGRADELAGQRNRVGELAVDASIQAHKDRMRAEAAEARADELQRELERERVAHGAAVQDGVDAASDAEQARREADQLRAALQQIADNEVPTTHGGHWTAARRFARAALAGVQADKPR